MQYDENQVNTANAGQLLKNISNMTIAGSFTLINLNPTNVAKLGGGIFEEVTTAGTPVTTSPDQTIAAGWSDNTIYDLAIETSSSDSTLLKASAKPTLTSVTLDPTGTPEVLVEDTEYVIIENPSSSSGYSIQFISGAMTTVSPTTYEIVIDYASVTPVSSTTIHAGTSSLNLDPVELKFTHTDANGLIRELQLHAVDSNSGGFQFNFKGANEDGTEEMPIAFTGKLDTSRTDGRQLMSWIIDSGAA